MRDTKWKTDAKKQIKKTANLISFKSCKSSFTDCILTEIIRAAGKILGSNNNRLVQSQAQQTQDNTGRERNNTSMSVTGFELKIQILEFRHVGFNAYTAIYLRFE
jgi:hypothetical protein